MNKVIIFGTGRSGSSLLLRLIDGSKGLSCYPLDFNYFHTFESTTWKRKLRAWAAYIVLGKRTNQYLEQYYFDRWRESQYREISKTHLSNINEPINEFYETNDLMVGFNTKGRTEAILQFFKQIGIVYGHAKNDDIVVFKTTECSKVEDYEKLYPDAKCIHIIRDPVNTYSSFKRAMYFKKLPPWWLGGDCLREVIDGRFLPHIRIIKNKLQTKPNSHLLVRYEDILEDSDRELNRIAKFLKVVPPVDTKTQTFFGGRLFKSMPAHPSQKNVATPKQVTPNLDIHEGYKKVIESREEILIRELTSLEASDFGYAKNDKCNHEDLLNMWRLPSKWELRFWFKLLSALRYYYCNRRWIREYFKNRANGS